MLLSASSDFLTLIHIHHLFHPMSDTILDKLTALGLSLPAVPAPVAAYVNCVRSGNLLFLSGGLPIDGDKKIIGKVPDRGFHRGSQGGRPHDHPQPPRRDPRRHRLARQGETNRRPQRLCELRTGFLRPPASRSTARPNCSSNSSATRANTRAPRSAPPPSRSTSPWRST